jgi:hypothetical protein
MSANGGMRDDLSLLGNLKNILTPPGGADIFDIAIKNAALSDLLLARKTTNRASTFTMGQRGTASVAAPPTPIAPGTRPPGVPGAGRPVTPNKTPEELAAEEAARNPAPKSPRGGSGVTTTNGRGARTPQTYVTPYDMATYDPDRTVLG